MAAKPDKQSMINTVCTLYMYSLHYVAMRMFCHFGGFFSIHFSIDDLWDVACHPAMFHIISPVAFITDYASANSHYIVPLLLSTRHPTSCTIGVSVPQTQTTARYHFPELGGRMRIRDIKWFWEAPTGASEILDYLLCLWEASELHGVPIFILPHF